MIALPVRLALVMLIVPGVASALQPQEEARRIPPQGSLEVGVVGVMEDGQSSRRISAFWHASERFVPGLTATFAHIDTVEPELRWFPNQRSSPFFLSTSFIYKDYGVERFGGSFALGLASQANEWLATSISLGWESVFAKGRADGPHWFRVQAGLAYVFPKTGRNQLPNTGLELTIR